MKTKLTVISTSLLIILTTMQTIKEIKITTNETFQEVNILTTTSANLISDADSLNNKSLSPKKAISNGDIVEISSSSWISSKTHSNSEVYNIKKLDDFMENIKNRKTDKLRIVKYGYENGKAWVNKLYELDYDGKIIKLIVYDTYSNHNAFIPNEPYYIDKIIKRDYPNDLWYGNCLVSNKGDVCVTLISMNKSSIVK